MKSIHILITGGIIAITGLKLSFYISFKISLIITVLGLIIMLYANYKVSK